MFSENRSDRKSQKNWKTFTTNLLQSPINYYKNIMYQGSSQQAIKTGCPGVFSFCFNATKALISLQRLIVTLKWSYHVIDFSNIQKFWGELCFFFVSSWSMSFHFHKCHHFCFSCPNHVFILEKYQSKWC